MKSGTGHSPPHRGSVRFQRFLQVTLPGVGSRWYNLFFYWRHNREIQEFDENLSPPAMWVMRPEFFWGWLIHRISGPFFNWRARRSLEKEKARQKLLDKHLCGR